MLSIALKYLRDSLFSYQENENDIEESIRTTREIIQKEKEIDDTEILKGIGVVYHADEQICSISKELEFQKSKFFGLFNPLNNLDEVIFEAKRCSLDTKWIVTSVKQYKDSDVEKRKRREQVCVYIVEAVDRENRSVFLAKGPPDRENRMIDLNLLEFEPQQGDYLNIHVMFNGIVVLEGAYPFHNNGIGIVSHAEPIYLEEKRGTVTRNHHYFCIDNTIYLENKVIENGRLPQMGDEVLYKAIESSQKPFSRRAIFVKIICGSRHRHQDKLDSWGDEEKKQIVPGSSFAFLLETRLGVSIYPKECLTFKPTPVNDVSTAIIEVKVTSLHPYILKKVYTVGDQNACRFHLIMNPESADYIAHLTQDSKFNIEVVCSPQVIGRTKDMIKFEFDSFSCIRFLEVNAVPQNENSQENEFSNNQRKHVKLRDREVYDKINQDSRVKTINGVCPYRSPFFQLNKMPHYSHPTDLWNALINVDENFMRKNYSFAKQSLTFENYVKKFSLSLWLEEIACKTKLQQYNITTTMRPTGGQLLVVSLSDYPDVASQLNSGDKIIVFFPGKDKDEAYKAHIKEKRETDLYATFPEDLYVKYNKEFVRVEFELSRTTFRRCHFAVESAVQYLGKSFLFPTEDHFMIKPAKILFDEEISESSKIKNEEPIEAVLKNPHRIERLTEPVINTLASRWNTRSKSFRPVACNLEAVESRPNGYTLKWVDKRLNCEQKEAVRRILRGQGRPLPYIIYGPPGTGKTVTVVEAIIQLFTHDSHSRILVTAPSNSAADLIFTKLLESRCFVPGDFVRLLGFLRADTGKCSEDMKPYLRTGEELEVVIKHRIIISTTSTTGQIIQIMKLREGYFTHVFIDEAGYCKEPETLLPCISVAYSHGGQVVLAGDPNQLGPVITSSHAAACGLGLSFLERLMKLPLYSRDEDKYPDTKYNPLILTKLVKNYRAHKALLKIPSKLFYEDELEPYASQEIYDISSDERFLKTNILVNLNVPITFRGVKGRCKRYDLTTWGNEFEVFVVWQYVKKLISVGLDMDDIGIITPYKGQVDLLKSAYDTNFHQSEVTFNYDGPKIGSTEDFQGGERKVILFTTVRSVSDKNLNDPINNFEFVLSSKRFNVSITRARSLLIVIGNPHVLVKDKNWLEFIKYCVKIGAYTGCDLPLELNEKFQDVIKSMQVAYETNDSSEVNTADPEK